MPEQNVPQPPIVASTETSADSTNSLLSNVLQHTNGNGNSNGNGNGTVNAATAPTAPPPKAKAKQPKVLQMPATLAAQLENLNRKYCFIRQIATIASIPTPDHPRPDLYSPGTFVHSLYPHLRVSNMPIASAWVKWPQRREAYKLDYAPGQEQFYKGNLNTWLPSPIKPQKGNLTRWHHYLDHLFRSDPTYREWFLHWLAYPLQNPGSKMHTAVVFWSTATATGKSTLGYIMGRLYGLSNFSEINEANLHDRFNFWAVGRQFIMGEEIKGSSSRKNADYLKSLITRKTVNVNLKNTPNYEIPDCLNYYFTSNHEEAFYLESTDRRFFVHELGSERFDPFYARLEFQPWLEDGGYEAILHELLSLDLSKPILGGNSITTEPAPFNPFSAAPNSKSRAEMINAGQDEAEMWLKSLSDTRISSLCGRDWSLATGHELYEVFCEYSKRSKIPEKAFQNTVKKVLSLAYNGNQIRLDNGDRIRLYVLNQERDMSNWTNENYVSCLSSERDS